jgi:hypothetical protein
MPALIDLQPPNLMTYRPARRWPGDMDGGRGALSIGVVVRKVSRCTT